MTIRKFTTAHYAAIVSTAAFFISVASFYVSKATNDFNVAKYKRELEEKEPAVDVRVRPDGKSNASVTITIINRGEVNVAPLDITVEHSFEAGDLYLSSAKQSVDTLKSSLNLSAVGTIAPKGVGTLNARVSGVTDGQYNSFTTGLELRFAVRIRFADEQDTIKTFQLIRRILPPLAAEPCPPSWTLAPRPPGC